MPMTPPCGRRRRWFWRCFLAGAPGAQTRLMSIDEVKPGMVGTGRTVFSGTTSEDFKVHVLGVLHNVIAPQSRSHSRAARGGPAREDRRDRRHERQSGLRRRPADGRRVVLARPVLDRADCRHHADCGDDRCDGDEAGGGRHAAGSLSWPYKPEELFEIWTRDLGLARPGRFSAGRPLRSRRAGSHAAAHCRAAHCERVRRRKLSARSRPRSPPRACCQ